MEDEKKTLQIIYLSFATTNFKGEEEIDELLEKSRNNNSSLNVTGMLLYRGGVFFQLLEGEHQTVQDLYAKISKDPRHKNIKLVARSESDTRLFSNWSMAYKKVENVNLDRMKSIIPWPELIKKAEAGESMDNQVLFDIMKTLALDI